MTPTPAPSLSELLYIQDPLCGWCYGMSPVISRIQQEFAGRVDVSVLCGGMVRGADVEPIADVWEDLQPSLAEVERVTGAQFGAAFRALGAGGNTATIRSRPAGPLRSFASSPRTRPGP